MRAPYAILKFVARAALNYVGFGIAGDLAVDVLPAIAQDVYEWWHKDRSQDQMREEVQQLASAPAAEIKEQAAEIVKEVAADQPPQVQQALVGYLSQVPGTVRRSLRRPADPTGTTVPPGLSFHKPEDLLPFLPARLPRFSPGDRPPGICS